MPKTVRVRFKGFSGDFDAAVGPDGMAIQGEIVGTTFDGVPDATTTIFDFPDGPLNIRHGTTTSTDVDIGFTLINPSQDPPGLAGKQLSFGGRLLRADDGGTFGENFRIATTFFPKPESNRDVIVRVINGNQEIKLHFALVVTDSS